ncbi:LPS export ABC transporter permease LptF [Pantoea sp. Aalb]|uniref:LPS export ABC transporter permease LptF n=1 Tax=Pantoea sp. Aalb TaxID=2576762 RepID=UPI001325315B|nr:LPS export ABC transporter permease LptF [Pantoea sp. Aalb]MXP67847.1 LPS export ABC transporter permease LptF [Pantoea sp. Aalb]
MIIIRYLVKETIKSQLVILFILLVIFFCQQLVKILNAAAEGNIPPNLIMKLLGLTIPEMAKLIFPLSLFLAILISFGRLYSENEITVMQACGLNNYSLIKSSIILIFFTLIMATINVSWLAPKALFCQSKIIKNIDENPSTLLFSPGRFHTFGNVVLFIEYMKGNSFRNAFLVQKQSTNEEYASVLSANSGHIEQITDNIQLIILDKGMRFEKIEKLNNFHITHFSNYRIAIVHKNTVMNPKNSEQINMYKLFFQKNNLQSQTELHWRLTLIFSILIMGLLAVPLSMVNPREGRVLSILPAMILYLIFFLLQSSFKFNTDKSKLDPTVWMWVVNFCYLALAIVLNLWDSITMRRIRLFFCSRELM